MTNQWGRDGNFSSSGSRSSGGAAIVIAAIVALALGVAGGYAAARMFSGASASDIAARDGKIADLEKQLSDLRFTTSGSAAQENVLRERVEELTKANETLKALADENDGKARSDAAAEIAALKRTIDEAGDLRGALNRARRSQQVSELQIIELEGEIKSQRAEMDKLRKSLTDSATRGDAGSKALSEQIKTFEASLAEARRQAASAAEFKKEAASLEDDLAQKIVELSAAQNANTALRKQMDKAKSDGARLQTDLAAAMAANRDKGGESEALRKELAAAREQLAARNGDISTLEARLTQTKRDLDDAAGKASQANAEKLKMDLDLGAVRTEKEKLEGEVAVLKQTIESLKAAQTETKPQPDVTDSGDVTPAATRRKAEDVRDALGGMPGYSRLTPERQIELARRLEDGECAADALKTTLGRVPAIALRNLIRDLGSKC